MTGVVYFIYPSGTFICLPRQEIRMFWRLSDELKVIATFGSVDVYVGQHPVRDGEGDAFAQVMQSLRETVDVDVTWTLDGTHWRKALSRPG